MAEVDPFGGRYRLIEPIAEGGMGVVYRAEHLALQRTVAIKMLRPEHAASAERLRRFEIEARAASRLRHRGTVTLYDYGLTTDGVPYLVMEYVDGPPLSQFLRDRWPVPLTLVVDLGLQILAAIGDAHDTGVIHADIKSDNILIESRRNGAVRPKIVDYGLARIVEETAEGTYGTAGFTAPEVVRGEPVTVAADLYSVGATLYELLAGMPPYIGDSTDAILDSQASDPLVPPSKRQPSRDIPPALEAVVLHALAHEPADRYASAEHFLAALDAARVGDDDQAPLRCPCGTIVGRHAPVCPECGHPRATLATMSWDQDVPTEDWRPARPRLARGSDVDHRPDERLTQLRFRIGEAIIRGAVDDIALGYLELARTVAGFIGTRAAVSELEEGVDLVTGGEGSATGRASPMLWRMLVELAQYHLASGDRLRARLAAGYARAQARAAGSDDGQRVASSLLANLRGYRS